MLCPISQYNTDAAKGKDGFHCLVTAAEFVPCSRQLDCYDCKRLQGEEIVLPPAYNYEHLGTIGETIEARMSWEDRYELIVMLNLSIVTEERRNWDLTQLQKQAILMYEDSLVINYSSTLGGVGGQTK